MRPYYLFILFLSFVTACNTQENTRQPEADMRVDTAEVLTQPEVITPEDTVLMTVKRRVSINQVSASIPITITNYTDSIITTGEYYHVERLVDSTWQKVPFDNELIFDDIGYELSPGGSMNLDFRLFEEAYVYRPGQYRLVKNYLKDDFIRTRVKFPLYAPFTIE